MTVTPVITGKQVVSLTTDGLNNGGNAISNVASNLPNTQNSSTANTAAAPSNATKSQAAPTLGNTANQVNPTNAATVSDVLNAGWNIQGNNAAVDFVKAYDTVNFVNGDGTTATVESADGKTSTVKYSANLGDGLEKTNDNKIKVKAADNTLTTDTNGLKVNTGSITASSVPTVADTNKDKIATVGNVADAIKAAAWKATSAATTSGENTGKKEQEVKAGDTVTFEADKNIKIAQDNGKFTFSTKDNVVFETVQVGGDQGPKLSKTDEGDLKVSSSNGTDPVKVTNVKSGLDTYGGNAPGTTTKNTGLVDLSKPTTGEPKVSDNTAATVGDLRNMGWIVSSDKTTGADGAVTAAEYSDKVKNANEVKFVGKNAAKVSGKTDPATGIRTITVDVEVPDVKTAELVSSKDGSVIAPSTNSELQKALKDAKDELAAAATPEQKEAAENKVKAAETELNKALDNKGVATAKNVAEAINNAGFNLKTSADGGEKLTTGTKNDGELIKPGNTVEMIAGKNLTVKQDESGKITYATKDDVEFNTVKVGTSDKATNGKKPVNLTTEAAKDASNNDDANKPTTALNISSGTGTDVKPTQLVGVGSVLNKTTINTTPTGTVPAGSTPTTADLVDLKGTDAAPVNKNAAATVGDLQNMGWVVSSDKATSTTGEYKDVVKNANEVRFVGEGTAVVSGKTDGNVRTITVKVDDQVSTNKSVTPVVYTDENGNQVYPTGKVDQDGKQIFNTKPDGSGQSVTGLVKTTINGPKGTTSPTSLSNVKNNVPSVNDEDTKVYDTEGRPVDGKNNTVAPLTAKDAANLLKPTVNGAANPNFVGNNAATVSDVLNAGWNLQNNGAARDFVKPYDTVNFVNGGNTVAVVTTNADKTASDVTFNVTGLPVSNTITENGKEIPVVKVGNTFYPANPDGTPNIVKDQNGNPTNGYVQANDGKVYPRDAVTITENPDGTTTVEPKAGKTPTTVNTNVVNPNVANTKDNPGNTVNTPTTVGNVKSGLDTYGDNVLGTTDKNRGLVDLSKPTNGAAPKVSDNTAATVGDLRNMGWIVSSNKTTGENGAVTATEYSNTVKNANEVRFIGKNGILVSGKSDDKGVRTLTFEMEAGEVTPTEITKVDGDKRTKLVKVGDKVYNAEDIGTDGRPKQGTDPVGTIANDGKVYNNGDVTNGAPNNGANPIDGITVTPNNGSKFVTGNQVADAIEKSGFVVGKNNKALSAADFKNEDEKVNPNDELRFADGDNTNVKLATKEVLDASGKVKTVTTVKFDVVDLPVKYTDADGNIVKKGEDGKYYNPKDLEGKVYDPTTKAFKNSDGKPLVAQPSPKDNVVSSLINPNDGKDGKAGTPSTLTNIANGAKTFEPTAADGTKLVQVGDKFYPADKVENGVLKPGTDATADAKDPVKVANDGNWYLASQVEANGKPKENATPIADMPNNIGKSGLVDFSNSNPNNAATVGDLQNLGFVVSTSDNKYSNQVRNANKVDFKGGNGIEVTGKTTADGIREITVGIKEGTVTNNVKVTKEDGTVIEAIRDKDGKLYEKDVNGKVDKTKPVETTAKDKVENNGSGFVTGNTVATAIQESGWSVGLADSSKANEAFNDNSKALSADTLEKVNPDDNVRFADGKNTKVQVATVDEVNKDGKKITDTYVRFNVDLPISQITSEDKDGNKVAKAADGKWYPVKEGKPDTTKEALEPSNVRTSASMDPDGLGDKYTSTTSREEGLTPTQLGELTGKQEAAAKAAEEKIKDLLKGQSKDVIEAASKAAVNAAKEEAKVQYLKDKGLDKGAGGTVISNVAWGTKPSDAVNVDQLQNSGINVHSRKVEDSTGKVISGNTSPTKVKMDETVNVDAGNNIEITRNGRDIAIATSMNPQFDSVQFGKEGPKITGKAAQPAKPATATSPATPAQPAELSVNGAKITNVAPGRISATSTDAINGSQLYGVAKGLDNRINNLQGQVNKLGNRMNAGMATSAAMANLLQPHKPGQSVATAGIGQHKDQAAVAVGYSRVSDNGKYGVRFSMGANTQGEVTSGAAVGYFW